MSQVNQQSQVTQDTLKNLYAEQVNLRIKGMQKEALSILDEMITNSLGQQYDLVREKAHCLYEMGEQKENLEEAITQYKLAIDLYPPLKDLSQQQKIDLSNTYVGQARAYSQIGNQEEALILLRRAKEVTSDNKDRIMIEKALVYYKQQKLLDAQELLLLVAQSPNQKIKQEAYYRLGFISEDPKQQLDFYMKADQDDHVILFNIGNCYMRLYQFSAAIEKYTFALGIKKEAKYVYNLAKCFEINGQFEDAIETYMKALTHESYCKISDILTDLRDKLSDGTSSNGNNEQSKASEKQYLVETTQEQEMKALFSIGNCFLHLKFYDQALTLYDQVLKSEKVTDEKALILFNKGISLYQLQKLDEAYKCYEQSFELNRKLQNNLFQMGNIKVDKKLYEEARKLFKASLKQDDNGVLISKEHIYNAKVKSNLGLCYQKLKMYEESEQCLSEAYDLDPKNYQILCNLGVLRIKQSNPREASELFKRALDVQKETQLPDNQRADNFMAIGSLSRISDMMKKFPKGIDEDMKKKVMSIVSDDQRGSEQEKTDKDVLERVLEFIDVSRKNQRSIEEVKESQQIIQKSVNKLEQEISKLQAYQQDMDKKYDDLKKLIPEKIPESEYDKQKKEELNEITEIYSDEFLTEYYYGMLEGFSQTYEIAKATRLSEVFDIQAKKNTGVAILSDALKFVPFVGGFLSEKVKDIEAVFKNRSLETKANIMMGFFPNTLIFDLFSCQVSRKVTLSMKAIKEEFFRLQKTPEGEQKGIVAQCKGLISWISSKVSEVKSAILTYATKTPDYEQSEIKVLAKTEVYSAFAFFFNFSMSEIKKKNQKLLQSTLTHPQKIAAFFIFILEKSKNQGKYHQDDEEKEDPLEGFEEIKLYLDSSESFNQIKDKFLKLTPLS